MHASAPQGAERGSGTFAAVEIDLGSLRRNVARLSALVAPTPFAAVVKANAYGHGLERVARALQDDVAAFCVYRVEEGLAIRAAGVATPVLVLGPVPARDLAAAHGAGLALTMWDDGAYRADAARVARAAGTPMRVHAKIETGVTRLGMQHERAAPMIAGYLDDAAFALAGVYTHLAAVEELESTYTLEQIARFERALAPLDAALRAGAVARHAAASAAAMLFPALRMDLVRVGIATYGLWPSAQTHAAMARPFVLEPVLAWRTKLVAVHDVPAGTSVGYGCTYRTESAARIGVLPIGYAEAIPRAVSNRGAVIAGGVRVPIVGRVCMNMTFVDVTNAPLARTGSAVTLIGSDGHETIGADDWAAWADTINYEIVARLPADIARTYTDGSAAPPEG